jgi:hypothetical protein
MLATDPLSLVFLGCILFSGGFLALSALLGGGHAHGLHLGDHGAHLGAHAGGHVHLGGHGAHAGAHAAAHGSGQTTAGSGSASAAAQPSMWEPFSDVLANGLNLYSLLMFLLVFGLLGYLLHNLAHVGVVLSLVLPALFGAICGLAVGNVLFRLFMSPTELAAGSSRLEGRVGEVSMAIREGGIGEVIFTRPGGGRQSVGARSANNQPIPAGSEVVILGYENGIASVQTWDGFMLDIRSGRAPLLDPFDPLDQLDAQP